MAKYVSRVLTTKLTKDERFAQAEEAAKFAQKLEKNAEAIAKLKADHKEELSKLTEKAKTLRANQDDALNAVRTGITTSEVQCEKKMVKGVEKLFRKDTGKEVDEADIVSGQQLDIAEAGQDADVVPE